jgi:hypothetical protein
MARKNKYELPENMRRALGIAYQVLQELPVQLRPESDIEDMQQILEGKGTGDTGRDGLLICTAVATALAWRTRQWPKFNPDLTTERMYELISLFEVVRQIPDTRFFAIAYCGACDRFANAEAQQP